MNDVVTPKFGMGAPIRRVEDQALVTGRGQFVADATPPGAVHGYCLRAPMAHGRFTVGDLAAARSAPGVALVLTAEDLGELGLMPCLALLPQVDGSTPTVPPRPVLADGIVRHIGEPVAFIVADSVNAAKSAAELIDIAWEPLQTTLGVEAALADGAAPVWPQLGTNQAFEFALGDADATKAGFDKAARISELRVVNNRVVCNYMETRGCIADYDPQSGRYTFTVGCQNGHMMRDILCGQILKIDPADMRVVTGDVGGGFGTKYFVYPEYPLSLHASRLLERPVKWIGERTEHFLSDTQGRDNVTVARLALDDDNRILAMEVDILADMGAYLSQFAPMIPNLGMTMSTGVYDIPAMAVRARGVFTNTVPVDAYRGAGRPEAAFLIERLIDQAGTDTGLGPVEIRRRNFIAPSAMPYTTPGGRYYDVGEFAAHLDLALEDADWTGFEQRAQAAKASGKIRGIGLASYIEACAFAGSEAADLELNDDGTVDLLIGTQSNGQGHATAYGQIAAAHLGIDVDRVRLVQGDTDRIASGGGTGGSRSIPIGLPSVDQASVALVQNIKRLAGDALEASEADLELVGGRVRVVGTDQSVTLAEVAAMASDPDDLKGHGLVEQAEATYPNGTHVCEVEIDPETGQTRIVAYSVVDDFGVIVNPILLAGQVHGGIVQGAGQALMEHTVYDADGQLLSASFMDYCMPRAGDFPPIAFQTRNVPSTTNVMGIKGAGEAGTIGATPAVANAVVDALRRAYGIANFDMPATPHRVWQAMRAAAP